MKVKIALQKGESKEVAEDLLFKALKAKRKMTTKHSEKFENPGAQATVNKMNAEHKKMYSKMLREILEIVEK